jgi:hypothetical protein
MKLELTKEWFEKNIPHDNPEVGAGLPERGVEQSVTEEVGMHRENGFAEAYAAGWLRPDSFPAAPAKRGVLRGHCIHGISCCVYLAIVCFGCAGGFSNRENFKTAIVFQCCSGLSPDPQ